jgi:tripartite-type tricarboxylate transporter receptor subunit TctC
MTGWLTLGGKHGELKVPAAVKCCGRGFCGTRQPCVSRAFGTRHFFRASDKGGASLTAVIANEAQFTIAPGPAVLAHVRANRLRAIASAGEKRSPLTPELPTVIESGLPGYISTA